MKNKLQEIADVIALFLKEHGAMSNGYGVRVEGILTEPWNNLYVVLDSVDSKSEQRNLGHELTEKVRKLVPAGYDLIVSYKHQEHGCYETTVALASKPIIVNLS